MTAQESEWEEFEAQALLKWPQLTESDLEQLKRAHEDLCTLLCRRLGMEEPVAEEQIEEWLHEIGEPIEDHPDMIRRRRLIEAVQRAARRPPRRPAKL